MSETLCLTKISYSLRNNFFKFITFYAKKSSPNIHTKDVKTPKVTSRLYTCTSRRRLHPRIAARFPDFTRARQRVKKAPATASPSATTQAHIPTSSLACIQLRSRHIRGVLRTHAAPRAKRPSGTPISLFPFALRLTRYTLATFPRARSFTLALYTRENSRFFARERGLSPPARDSDALIHSARGALRGGEREQRALHVKSEECTRWRRRNGVGIRERENGLFPWRAAGL